MAVVLITEDTKVLRTKSEVVFRRREDMDVTAMVPGQPARSSKQDCVATLRFAMGSCAHAAEVLSVARRSKRRPAKEHRIS
jgi:hypothetical protein